MFISDQTSVGFLSMLGMVATATAAAVTDWRNWRIPNRLLAIGASVALILAAFDPHGITLKQSLLGGLTGFAMLLPLYMVRGMAAGDVKLMAVLGLYAGPMPTIDIVLLTLVVSGVWSLGILIALTPFFQWGVLGLRARLNIQTRQRAATGPEANGIKKKRVVFPFGVATGIATVTMAVSLAMPIVSR